MSDDEIATIYSADRADGSAIYQVNMALLAGITTYGALVVAATGANFVVNPWVRAFVGAPLWGLLCYQSMLLALSTARVNSINILEEVLLQRSDLSLEQKNQIGSDAGDWITNIKHQPRGLRPANIAAFGAFALAAAAVAIGSLFSVLHSPPNYLAFAVGAVVHAVFVVFLLCAAWTLFFGDIITKIRDRPKYKPENPTS